MKAQARILSRSNHGLRGSGPMADILVAAEEDKAGPRLALPSSQAEWTGETGSPARSCSELASRV